MWFSHSDSRWDILSVIARNVYQKWQTKLCRDLQTYYIYGINPCVSSKMRYMENSNVRKIKQQQSANYGTWPKSGPRTFCSVGLQDFSTWRHIYLGYNFRRFPKQIDLGDWFFFLNIMPIVQPLPFMDPVHLFWEGSEGGTGGISGELWLNPHGGYRDKKFAGCCNEDISRIYIYKHLFHWSNM